MNDFHLNHYTFGSFESLFLDHINQFVHCSFNERGVFHSFYGKFESVPHESVRFETLNCVRNIDSLFAYDTIFQSDR